jgi:hypothetical protein
MILGCLGTVPEAASADALQFTPIGQGIRPELVLPGLDHLHLAVCPASRYHMRRMHTPQAECVGNVTVASYQPCSEKVQPEAEIWQGTLHSLRPLIAIFPGLAIS